MAKETTTSTTEAAKEAAPTSEKKEETSTPEAKSEEKKETTPEVKKEESPRKEEIKQAILEAEKTPQQELNEAVRYPGLKLVSRFAKVFGIVLLVLFWIIAIVQLFVAEGWDKLVFFLLCIALGIIWGILGFCFGDFMQIFIDIEENTRKKNK